MPDAEPLVIFTLDEQRYALYLSAVERIVRAVEITPLPQAPEIVLGIINVQGRVIPVLNIRRRFRRPQRDLNLPDHLILARTRQRAVALVVDTVSEVRQSPEVDRVSAAEIVPGLEYVTGIAKLPDGMILIHDLEKFLSLEEAKSLEEAMASAGGRG